MKFLTLVLIGALLRPAPAYSEDEFVPPGQYNQDATQQKINGIRDLFFGDDPIAAYAVLTYFTLQRVAALKNLFTQVPTAIGGASDLYHFRTLRREYLEHYNKVEDLKKAQPELFYNLQTATYDHSDRLRDVEDRLRQLAEKPGIQANNHWNHDLVKALSVWEVERDITRLDEFLDRYKDDPAFVAALGSSWLKDFEALRQLESRAAGQVSAAANRITERMNLDLPVQERIALVNHNDTSGRHNPGVFFHSGAGNGSIRLSSSSLVTNMKERCELALKSLGDKTADLKKKGGIFSPFGSVGKIGAPVFTLGSALVLSGLTARVYYLSFKKYGKDPSAAQKEVRHRNQVRDDMNVKGEASFSGQVAKRETEIRPFLDPVTEIIIAHKDEILAKAKELHAKTMPGVEIDWDEKAKLLASDEALRFQIGQSLPFAVETIGRDINFNQFLWFLNEAPNKARSTAVTQTFLDGVYSRTMDGIFPELMSTVESNGSYRTVGVGFHATPALRQSMIKETLPKLKGLKFAVPEGTPLHPAIPQDPPKKVGGVAPGGLGQNDKEARADLLNPVLVGNLPNPAGP